MASAMILRGGATARLAGLLRPSMVAPSAVGGKRFFSTVTEMTPTDGDNQQVNVDRRSGSSLRRRGDSFSDIFDPLSPIRGLSQMLNMMDQLMGNSSDGGMGRGGIDQKRSHWASREDDEALYLRVEMPGLDKDEVKVCVENNTLVVKGEGSKVSEDLEEYERRYYRRLDLPGNVYKLDGVRAQMKNGVLKIVVPKTTLEERKDVLEVSID